MSMLKFRAWHKELKRMSNSFTLFDLTDAYDEGHFCWGDNKLFLGDHPSDNPDNIELMQWSQHTDKNKVDIYVGDIIKLGGVDNYFIEDFVGLYVLRWDQLVEGRRDGMKIVHRDKLMHEYATNQMEVIGNIYENSNLLGEK